METIVILNCKHFFNLHQQCARFWPETIRQSSADPIIIIDQNLGWSIFIIWWNKQTYNNYSQMSLNEHVEQCHPWIIWFIAWNCLNYCTFELWICQVKSITLGHVRTFLLFLSIFYPWSVNQYFIGIQVTINCCQLICPFLLYSKSLVLWSFDHLS